MSTLLDQRNALSIRLQESPYSLILYYSRALVYERLEYFDLAAGDANKSLLLIDEILDQTGEYQERALDALSHHLQNALSTEPKNGTADVTSTTDHESRAREEALVYASKNLDLISHCLLQCGCIKSAYQFCERGLRRFPEHVNLLLRRDEIRQTYRHSATSSSQFNIDDLPEHGFTRRELYPWNVLQPDRTSADSLRALNGWVVKSAPKIEVKAVSLPSLHASEENGDDSGGSYKRTAANTQLGVFAIEDIQPGEVLLNEISFLTACNRPLDPFCDGCNASLPPLHDTQSETVACPECNDVFFCSDNCFKSAELAYHKSVCGLDIDIVSGERVEEKYSQHMLYLLLLRRALAMSIAQDIHPLMLQEVSHIWGDFSSSESKTKLPFSFQHNIAGPLSVLEKMEIDIFNPPISDLSETWVFNTLYAKFRGTASAFLSPVSRKPEISAVHPIWCMANHDCDPNVAWEWKGGRMKMWARSQAEKVSEVDGGSGGIRAGEEIRSHYCDVFMDYKKRREWAYGSLGGNCMCKRCIQEETESSRSLPIPSSATGLTASGN